MKNMTYAREGDLFCLDDRRQMSLVLAVFAALPLLIGSGLLINILYQLLFTTGGVHGGMVFVMIFTLFFGFLLLSLKFERYLSLSGRYLLTRQRYFFISWEEKQPLAPFTKIQLQRVFVQGSSDNHSGSMMFRVALDTRYAETELSSDSEYVVARAKAEQLVRHFRLPLEDLTQADAVLIPADKIDEPVPLLVQELPTPPANSAIRLSTTDAGLRFTLPARQQLPFTALFRLLVIIGAALYMHSQLSVSVSSGIILAFDGAIFLIAVFNLVQAFYPYYFRPWIDVSRSGICTKLNAFKRAQPMDLRGLEEARVLNGRKVRVRSDHFFAEIPVNSHAADAEFLLQVLAWLATIGASFSSQPGE